MFHVPVIRVVQLCFFSMIFSSYCAEQKPPTMSENKLIEWAPVDDSDWDVFMDAPAYHFKLAKEYLQKGDGAKAASELERGNTFLNYEKDRMELVVKQIRDLAKKVATGKENNIYEFDAVTSNALKIVGKTYAMVPVDIKGNPVFENAYKYHFENAKLKLRENNRAEAASEIRKAAAFLRLRAAQTSKIAKADLEATRSELKKLAVDVESGMVKDVVELDRAFQKAISIFSNKKD